MRGIQGLLIAIGLGICGALFNWIYLSTRTREMVMDDFVGIRPKIVVQRNEILTPNHLVPVPVPREAVGTLKDFAIPYSARQSVVGHAVTRSIPGGSLLLNDDLRTSPTELSFGHSDKDGESRERAMWVPFDTRALVPSLITPGDMVSFLIPRSGTRPAQGRAGPTPAKTAPAGPVPAADGDATAPIVPIIAPGTADPAGTTETLGPFKVLSVGNRLGSVAAFAASRGRQSQENVLTISVTVDLAGQLEPKAHRLWELLRASNFQQVGVMLHPRK